MCPPAPVCLELRAISLLPLCEGNEGCLCNKPYKCHNYWLVHTKSQEKEGTTACHLSPRPFWGAEALSHDHKLQAFFVWTVKVICHILGDILLILALGKGKLFQVRFGPISVVLSKGEIWKPGSLESLCPKAGALSREVCSSLALPQTFPHLHNTLYCKYKHHIGSFTQQP